MNVDLDVDGFAQVAAERKLGRVPVLLVRMNADLVMHRTESRLFRPPTTGRIAVKVINGYGDEVVQVFDVESALDRGPPTD